MTNEIRIKIIIVIMVISEYVLFEKKQLFEHDEQRPPWG